MITKCKVASDEGHIIYLTFASIGEYIFILPLIFITVLMTSIS